MFQFICTVLTQVFYTAVSCMAMAVLHYITQQQTNAKTYAH